MNVDCVVVGAGPAGAATANILGSAGARVALCQGPPAPPALGDHLPGRARPLLAELGLWPRFLGSGALPSLGVTSLWDEGTPVPTPGIFNPWGAGWHVDRGSFDALVREAAEDRGAMLMGSAASIQGQPGQWRVFTEDGEIGTRWLVDATGRRCWVARQVGVAPVQVDALVGVARHWRAPGLAPHAMVEAVEEGWWYSTALPARRGVSIYFTDAVATVRADSDASWRSCRTTARFVDAVEDGPLRMARVATQWCVPGPGWLPVGDAALGRDPLSSGGLMGALLSARCAANAIIGESSAEYESWLEAERSRYLAERADVYGRAAARFGGRFWKVRSIEWPASALARDAPLATGGGTPISEATRPAQPAAPPRA